MNIRILLAVAYAAFLPAALLLSGQTHAGTKSNTELEMCKNIQYALCAASTCKETGQTIAVNKPEGGTRLFPEAECTCPVLPSGDEGALGNVNGGNMQGSCNPPPGGGVWSLYQPLTSFPQKNYGWNWHASKLNTTCTLDLTASDRFANCFSFSCDNVRQITSEDGTAVTVASCHCPINEDVFSALPTKPGTGFLTEAGGDLPTVKERRQFCKKLPVGGF